MAQPTKPGAPKSSPAGKAAEASKPMAAPAKPQPAPAAKAAAPEAKPAPAPKPAATPAPKPAAAPAPVKAAGGTVGHSERARMISEAAYFIAQRRGGHGNPEADWLTAEKQIDQALAQRR